GSIFAHGDQASHRWKSLTWANGADGGAAIVAERATANSGGWSATTIAKIARIATKPIRTFLRIEKTFERGLGAPGAGSTMTVLLNGTSSLRPGEPRVNVPCRYSGPARPSERRPEGGVRGPSRG